jgi:hypothetical protein
LVCLPNFLFGFLRNNTIDALTFAIDLTNFSDVVNYRKHARYYADNGKYKRCNWLPSLGEMYYRSTSTYSGGNGCGGVVINVFHDGNGGGGGGTYSASGSSNIQAQSVCDTVSFCWSLKNVNQTSLMS